MLLEFTRKPTKFRLVMRPALVATSHHFGIAMPSKEYIATLRPCFDGGAATQTTTQSSASAPPSDYKQEINRAIFKEIYQMILEAPDTPDKQEVTNSSDSETSNE